jgi:hypothetical protein
LPSHVSPVDVARTQCAAVLARRRRTSSSSSSRAEMDSAAFFEVVGGFPMTVAA